MEDLAFERQKKNPLWEGEGRDDIEAPVGDLTYQ